MSADLAPGARIRIRTGMAGGRVGTVLSTGPSYPRPAVRVEVEIPVLLTEPDGPTHVVQMPYAPDELEVLAPEPAPAPAAERAPRDAEARGTAAHAIASARSRGLHGRSALADAYQSLTAGLRLLLREDDPGVDRWGRAVALVFERWTALEDELDAPVPYVPTGPAVERERDDVADSHAVTPADDGPGRAWGELPDLLDAVRSEASKLRKSERNRREELRAVFDEVANSHDPAPPANSTGVALAREFGQAGLREVVANPHRVDPVEPLHQDLDGRPEGVVLGAEHESGYLIGIVQRADHLLMRLEAALDRIDHRSELGGVLGHGGSPSGHGASVSSSPVNDDARERASSGPSVGEQVRPLGDTPDGLDTPKGGAR